MFAPTTYKPKKLRQDEELKDSGPHQTVMPYLILRDAKKFIAFTKSIFNATEITKVMRDENISMHAEIMIGENTLMLADSTEGYEPRTSGFFVYVDNADATYKKAIGSGATIVTPLSDQPYGRSGGIVDAFWKYLADYLRPLKYLHIPLLFAN